MLCNVGAGSLASRPRMSARTSGGAGRPRAETSAIREWATANGLEVSTRGRIASTVLEAYANRGNAAAAVTPVPEPVVESAAEAEAKPKRRTRKKATQS